ncbi:MAG: SAM-dependent methyltransferase ['Candidatus Kapabacteria' thiocyanatum]|nr:SAM-dependent methyltransferase ['Candidatus Kapabacteria' thiocyanatum]
MLDPTPTLPHLVAASDPLVATFSAPAHDHGWATTDAAMFGAPVMPRKITLKRTGNVVRCESQTDRQHFTKMGDDIGVIAARLAELPYRQVLIQTPGRDLHIMRSARKPERFTVKERPPSRLDWSDPAGDRTKQHPLLPERDAALLHALDLATADGVIRAPMADKFRQLNHLITIALTLDALTVRSRPLTIIDAGCGKAYLSLALYHVLKGLGLDVHLLGIDSNPAVIDHCRTVASGLGFVNARFDVGRLEDLAAGPCDILIALHACDTATDAALMAGLKSSAGAMLVAPCCHHYVQTQLHRDRVPEGARLLLDDGITRERLGDLLTDTMRRDILQAFGYQAHLEEFISLEHTMKNVLLKAERRSGTFDVRQYDKVLATAELWGARPKLLELTAVR